MAKNKAVEAEVTEVEQTEEEQVVDLSSFESAVESALDTADSSTGVVPDAEVAKVRDEYQALNGVKAKNAAKAALQERLRVFLTDLNGVAAKAVMQLLQDAAVAGRSPSTSARREVDPTEAYVAHLTQLTLALFLAQRNAPEGVADVEGAASTATENARELFDEAVSVYESEDQDTDNPLIRSAIRLATAKVRKSRGASTGERRDLGAHIEEAFASVDSGTFLTVAQIRKFESSVYGTDHPSAGAITNRLQPKSGKPTTIPGVTVETRDGKLGAVKN